MIYTFNVNYKYLNILETTQKIISIIVNDS